MIVQGGRVVREREYTDDRGQRATDDGDRSRRREVAGVYLLDEPAFESNLNQMFVLGRFDRELFEEVFNDFPNARAFRVRTGPR